MKNSVLLIAAFIIISDGNTQNHGGIEQLISLKDREILLMPIAKIQNRNNWYAEARYNYEAERTFSLYAGKVFSKTAKLSYEIIPILGAVVGEFNGGSAGANITMNTGNLFFSSQSQYTFSTSEKVKNFIYSWSEITYHPGNHVFAGFSIQQTSIFNKYSSEVEPGIVAGLTFGNWSLPLYLFNPVSSNRYFVLAINWDWESKL